MGTRQFSANGKLGVPIVKVNFYMAMGYPLGCGSKESWIKEIGYGTLEG
jgi:hypothetical protein